MEINISANMVFVFVTIIVYLIIMVAVGIICSKKNDNVGDFYLGGRRLGPLVTAMSAEASDMSSYLLMGLPGLAFLCGTGEVSWTCIGLAVGTYLNWLFVARRLRLYSAKNGAITIPDFFSRRYGDSSNIISAISAVIILVFFIPYTASGFSACGKLFGTLFGVDYHVAMLISAVIIISYTSIGGFLAASTTDLIQSIVMSVALVILIVFGVSKAGGMGEVIENAKGLTGYLSLTQSHVHGDNSASPFGFLPIVSTLAWGLGYFGMPHILLRFMAIQDDKKIKLSRRIASVWVVISMGIAILIGIIGNAMVQNGSISVLSDNSGSWSSESETVVIKMAQLMAEHSVITAVFAGLIFSGILACTMSTSDSQLLAASSSMSEDLLHRFFKIELDEKKSMIAARAVLVIIAVISVGIAWNPDSSVFRVVSFAWAGFGATFGPLMLLALFWRRSNKQGAVAGLVAGAVMVFVWKFAVRPMGGAWDIYELLPAFIVALVINVIVSLATKAPEDHVTDTFDKVNAEIKGS